MNYSHTGLDAAAEATGLYDLDSGAAAVVLCGEQLHLRGGNSFFQALKAGFFSTGPRTPGINGIVDVLRGHLTEGEYEDTEDEAIDVREQALAYLKDNLSQVCEGDEELLNAITNTTQGPSLLTRLSMSNFAVPSSLLKLMCTICSVRSSYL